MSSITRPNLIKDVTVNESVHIERRARHQFETETRNLIKALGRIKALGPRPAEAHNFDIRRDGIQIMLSTDNGTEARVENAEIYGICQRIMRIADRFIKRPSHSDDEESVERPKRSTERTAKKDRRATEHAPSSTDTSPASRESPSSERTSNRSSPATDTQLERLQQENGQLKALVDRLLRDRDDFANDRRAFEKSSRELSDEVAKLLTEKEALERQLQQERASATDFRLGSEQLRGEVDNLQLDQAAHLELIDEQRKKIASLEGDLERVSSKLRQAQEQNRAIWDKANKLDDERLRKITDLTAQLREMQNTNTLLASERNALAARVEELEQMSANEAAMLNTVRSDIAKIGTAFEQPVELESQQPKQDKLGLQAVEHDERNELFQQIEFLRQEITRLKTNHEEALKLQAEGFKNGIALHAGEIEWLKKDFATQYRQLEEHANKTISDLKDKVSQKQRYANANARKADKIDSDGKPAQAELLIENERLAKELANAKLALRDAGIATQQHVEQMQKAIQAIPLKKDVQTKALKEQNLLLSSELDKLQRQLNELQEKFDATFEENLTLAQQLRIQTKELEKAAADSAKELNALSAKYNATNAENVKFQTEVVGPQIKHLQTIQTGINQLLQKDNSIPSQELLRELEDVQVTVAEAVQSLNRSSAN